MMRDLHGAAPEVLHRETGGGRWAGEDVMGGVRGGAALGTQVGIRDVDCMSVGVEAGTLPRPQLGQGGTEVAGAGRSRILLGHLLARWLATTAVCISLMVDR